MSTTPRSAVPELAFTVHGVEPLAHAAAPTLALKLGIRRVRGAPVRALLLRVEVRIALARRGHDALTRRRLAELFGAPAQWRSAPRSLAWLTVTVTVPAFDEAATVEVRLPCTYDFEVTAAKYLHALEDGDVPLDVLLAGSVFYGDEGGLRTVRLAWDRETAFDLPVRVWKELMALYFPDAVWLRLDRAALDRLWAYRARHALPTWEATLDALLREPAEAAAWTR